MTEIEAEKIKYREKWLKQLKKICLAFIDTDKYAVFLFGSAVNNIVKAHDFDVGVLGDEDLPLDVMGEIYYIVDESIIPLKVDIVDFKNVDSEFKKEALSDIEIWNKPPNIVLN